MEYAHFMTRISDINLHGLQFKCADEQIVILEFIATINVDDMII